MLYPYQTEKTKSPRFPGGLDVYKHIHCNPLAMGKIEFFLRMKSLFLYPYLTEKTKCPRFPGGLYSIKHIHCSDGCLRGDFILLQNMRRFGLTNPMMNLP